MSHDYGVYGDIDPVSRYTAPLLDYANAGCAHADSSSIRPMLMK